MASEALRIPVLLRTVAFVAFNFNDFYQEISIKQNTATASKIQKKLT